MRMEDCMKYCQNTPGCLAIDYSYTGSCTPKDATFESDPVDALPESNYYIYIPRSVETVSGLSLQSLPGVDHMASCTMLVHQSNYCNAENFRGVQISQIFWYLSDGKNCMPTKIILWCKRNIFRQNRKDVASPNHENFS